jgi:hypothetical protein
VLFAPTLRAFVAGGSERSSLRAFGLAPGTDWTDLLGPVLTLRTYLPPGGLAEVLPSMPSERQVVLLALAVVGAAIFVRYHRAAWVIGWIMVIALSVFASTTDNRVIRVLTFPWYSGSIRINWNQALFVPLFAAVPLAIAVPVLARVLRRRSALVPAALVVALFIAFVGFHAYRTGWAFLRSAFAVRPATFGNQARVDGSSEAAFEWLAANGKRNDTVVNEPNVDGSLWMYTLQGVKPLMGLRLVGSPPSQSASRDWNDRRYLVQHIHELGTNPRVAQLAHDFDARWVYFDERNFPVARHEMRIDAIRSNPHISEVFRRDTVHVFRIEGRPAPRAEAR